MPRTQLRPDAIHLADGHVPRVVQDGHEKRIEKVTRARGKPPGGERGIGLPRPVANRAGDKGIALQSENGVLGMGPFPFEGGRIAGVGRGVVVMDHANTRGDAKVLKECTLPLTGAGVVDRVITNLGVLDVVDGGLQIVELADSVTEDELRARTESTIV